MAFIKLSEEKKRAMLMEMGYSKEQIDSILDSCKGNKAVTVGNSIGRTLIEKIADKDGNKHGRLGNTGKASTLGLAGIKGPGQFNTDFAKTNAVATDATTAGSGSSSKDKQKPKQKPKNNKSGNNPSSSGTTSTGNNTTSTADPYAEYKTGDEKVDAEIDRLFEEYGDDLSKCYEDDDFSWETASDTTRRALSRIAEVDLEKIEYSFSDDECANCLERVETILTYMVTLQGSSDQTVFNSGYLNEMYGYMTNGIAKKYINEFGALQRSDYDYIQGYSLPEIWIDGAGVCFGFEDGYGNVTEMLCHTSIARTNKYIDKCEKEKPGCFDHEYSLLEGDTDREKKENLIALYNTAKTSGDIELLDRLFKSDASYKDVFVGDPGNISANAKLVLGQHANILADDSNKPDYKEYFTFCNAVLSDFVYASKYTEAVAVGSGLAADSIIDDIWAYDYSGKEESDIKRKLEIANNNELLWQSIYSIQKEKSKDGSICNMSLSAGESMDFTEQDSVNFSIAVISTGINGDLGSTYDVKLNPTKGPSAPEWIMNAQIAELNKLKEEAAKNVLLDTACSLLDIYCKGAGKGLKLLLDASENATNVAKDQALDAYSNMGDSEKAQVTLYNAGDKLVSKISNYNLQGDTYKAVADAAIFDTVMGYSYQSDGDNRGYYTKFNNYNKIKALKAWNNYGCSVLYGNNGNVVENDFGKKIEDGTYLTSIKNQTTEFVFFQKYSDEEILSALNALVYGCNDSDHTTDYKSIRDIPTELRLACTTAIDDNRGNYKEIENAYCDYGI
jgi:hypothetical protein